MHTKPKLNKNNDEFNMLRPTFVLSAQYNLDHPEQ